jgi:hypothetical protein
MADQVKEEQQIQQASTEAEEISKVDNKIKLAALAIMNFKKTIAIVITLALAASLVALAVSGWSCGDVKKDEVEIRK